MSAQTEEMDVAISNMESSDEEARAAHIVRGIAGVEAARILPRGIWMRYRPRDVTPGQIIEALIDEDFKATLVQDSASGETGVVNY